MRSKILPGNWTLVAESKTHAYFRNENAQEVEIPKSVIAAYQAGGMLSVKEWWYTMKQKGVLNVDRG